jgi:integral membrane protein
VALGRHPWRVFATPLARLRTVGKLEALSFVGLLFIAMPLKYMADMPLAVRVVGLIHGVLFVLFCIVLLQAYLDRDWPLKKAAMIFGAALLPFGPFVIDRRLADEDAGEAPAAEPS